MTNQLIIFLSAFLTVIAVKAKFKKASPLPSDHLLKESVEAFV